MIFLSKLGLSNSFDRSKLENQVKKLEKKFLHFKRKCEESEKIPGLEEKLNFDKFSINYSNDYDDIYK